MTTDARMTSTEAKEKYAELNRLGSRLADLNHTWSPTERRLYSNATSVLARIAEDESNVAFNSQAGERYDLARTALFEALKTKVGKERIGATIKRGSVACPKCFEACEVVKEGDDRGRVAPCPRCGFAQGDMFEGMSHDEAWSA